MKTIAIGCNENGDTFTVTAEETPTVTTEQLAELRQKLIAESQRRINMRNGMRTIAEAIHEKHRWLFAPEPKPSASHDERQYIKRSIFAHPVDFAEAVAEVLGGDSVPSPMDHDAIDGEHIGADFSERPYLY